jgi:membrane protein YqaA with SNARE-associated domain
MLRRLYNWTLALAARPDAMWALAAIAFLETWIFPIPTDVLIIAMVLANRDQAWKVAAIATVCSVLGGYVGYAIGALLFDQVALPIFHFYGYMDQFAELQGKYEEWGFLIVFVASFTPFPDKLMTIMSGVIGQDLVIFTIALLLARAARFFLVAALLWRFGPPIKTFIEKHLEWVTVIGSILLIGGFVAIKYLV